MNNLKVIVWKVAWIMIKLEQVENESVFFIITCWMLKLMIVI